MAHLQKALEPKTTGRGRTKQPLSRQALNKAGAAGNEALSKVAKKPRSVGLEKIAAPAAQDGSIMSLYMDFIGADPVVAIRNGLPVSAADDIVRSGAITSGEFYNVVMPRKTLTNRRATGSLTPDQSDKLIRVARVIAKAEQTFGNPQKAHRWLRRPIGPLGGEAPLNLLDTEAGARQVEELLARIDHGIAA